MYSNDFMSFMGFRDSLCEEKIEECLALARQGVTAIEVDAGDLTADEIEYVQREVRRRVYSGKY